MGSIENRKLIYAYDDAKRIVEICEIDGYRFRINVHRLGNSITVWNRMNTEWGFVHALDGDLSMFTLGDIRDHLLRIAMDVVGVGRNE